MSVNKCTRVVVHVVGAHTGVPAALEQWDRHAATILQGQSVGGGEGGREKERESLLLGALGPTTRGPMPLKKDNRLLIYDLDSLASSPSTFRLSPSRSSSSCPSVFLSLFLSLPP